MVKYHLLALFALLSGLTTWLTTPATAQDNAQEPEIEWRDPPMAPPAEPIIRYRKPSKASPPQLGGSVRKLFTPADYPAELWDEGPTGRVRYQVTVDAQGKPSACEVTETSGYPAFDDRTCKVMLERSRFRPARDREGEFTKGTYKGSHFWSKPLVRFEGPHELHIAFTVTAEGLMEDCEVLLAEGEVSEQTLDMFSNASCPTANRVLLYSPFRDENGEPVERRVITRTTVEVIEPSE